MLKNLTMAGAGLALLAACGGGDDETSSNNSEPAQLVTQLEAGDNFYAELQGALIEAKPGETIVMPEGCVQFYRRALARCGRGSSERIGRRQDRA